MLPEGWKLGSVSDLADTVMGFAFKSADFTQSGIPLLRMGNLYQNTLDFERSPVFLPESFKDEYRRFLVKPGDLVMSMTGTMGKRDYGFTVEIPNNAPNSFLNQRVMKFIPKEGVSAGYLLNLLRSELILSRLYSFPGGTKQANLSAKQVQELPAPLAPLPEQKKIAQILSTWDQSITATERLLKNSQQRKKGLMQQLLTGKKRLLGFEGEWSQSSLAKVSKIIVSPVDKKTSPDEQPVRLCNYTDVYYNTRIVSDIPFMEATAKEAEIRKYTLAQGDVVITKDSETPGDIAVPALIAEDLGGVVCGYHLAIIRPNPKKLNGAFLNYLLSMPKTRYYFFSLATGATRFGLSVGAIHNAELVLPPVPEQKAIADVLTICDDECEGIAATIDRLKQEKKALMQQLLTGKRRVQAEADAA